MPSLNDRIGDVIKRKRQRDRLTQTELGSRIGVSGSYISSLEAAQTSPRLTEVEALATVFRSTAFDLITEAAQPDHNTFSDTNRERNAFLGLYDVLAPQLKQQARSFLMFLRHQQEHPEDMVE